MKCWICGVNDADSREHLIKASDVRDLFGTISQLNPIFGHTVDNNYEVISKNQRMGSSKSDKLKLGPSLCKKCNSDETSMFDNAWMKLCRHLSLQRLDTQDNLKIQLGNVFPYKRYENALFVHLYFVKHFGCRIIDSDTPIDTKELSQSLIDRKPCKSIFLLFKKWGKASYKKQATLLPIEVHKKNNQIFLANTSYSLGKLTIEILYSPNKFRGELLDQAFHPQGPKNRILIFKNV